MYKVKLQVKILKCRSTSIDQPGNSTSPAADKEDSKDGGTCTVSGCDVGQLIGCILWTGSCIRVALAGAASVRRQRTLRLATLTLPMRDHIRREDTQGTHITFERCLAIPLRLVPPPPALSAGIASRALLCRCQGGLLDLREDLIGSVGRNGCSKGKTGGQETFEAVLIPVAHHVGLTGDLGHNVAAVFLREEP